MRSLFFSIALLMWFLPLAVKAQKPAQFLEKGMLAEESGDYGKAFSYFQRAYELDSSSFEATLKYAGAARLVKDYDLAFYLYSKVAAKDKGKLYPLSSYWQGAALKNQGKYEEALEYFRKYAKKNKKKGEYYYEKAMAEIEACAWAANYRNVSDSLQVFPLPTAVNSAVSEIAPHLAGSQFTFTRFNEEGQSWQAFDSNWADSVLTDVKESIAFDANSKLQANVFYYGDNEVFLTIRRNDQVGIWQGKKVGDQWKEVAFITKDGAVCTMPFVTKWDGKDYLFFASNAKGGLGGMDIWYARREAELFGEAFNAGEKINTPDDELTPFVSEGVLYFSSEGHQGFGGQDVFRAKGKPGNFLSVENMGKPINSSVNDIGFAKYPERGWLFFSSNRKKKEEDNDYSYCCNDIYAASFGKQEEESDGDLPYSSLEEMNRFLPITLYFHNDEPNPNTRDTTTTLAYSDAYVSYKKLKEKYINEVERTSEAESAANEVENFFALRVEKGMQDLTIFSTLLLKELEKGNSVTLSIRGFASPRAESDYNERLTKRRIQSLVNEMRLLSNGAFIPYIEQTDSMKAQLRFKALPFGENKANAGVSDDLADEKKSIYSLGARLERKIEIESAAVEIPSLLQLDRDFYDFGVIDRTQPVEREFTITNNSNEVMELEGMESSCGCTEPRIDKTILQPGEKATITVGFNPFGKKGKEIRFVTLYPKGQEPIIITIEAEVK